MLVAELNGEAIVFAVNALPDDMDQFFSDAVALIDTIGIEP